MALKTKNEPRRIFRVLVVDDNLDHVHSMAYLLKDMGHHVDYAINGIVALEVAQRARPDVIVLDVVLPDTSGLTLVRQFRRHPELRSAYIVGITGKNIDRAQALAAGFDELLTKPVEPRTLESVIARR